MDATLKTFAKEVHHTRIKNFQRRKVIVTRADETWGIDLAQMDSYVTDNDGYKFIMCVIDVFSKFAFCVHLKNKTALSILTHLRKSFQKAEEHQKRYGQIRAPNSKIKI